MNDINGLNVVLHPIGFELSDRVCVGSICGNDDDPRFLAASQFNKSMLDHSGKCSTSTNQQRPTFGDVVTLQAGLQLSDSPIDFRPNVDSAPNRHDDRASPSNEPPWHPAL